MNVQNPVYFNVTVRCPKCGTFMKQIRDQEKNLVNTECMRCKK